MKSFKNDFLKEQALKDYLDSRVDLETIDRVSGDTALNLRVDDAEAEIALRQLLSEKNQNSGYAGLDASGNLVVTSDNLSEGTSNLYFLGSRVLATVLSGLNVLLTGSILDTDSILAAFGKIQYQINNLQSGVSNLFSGKTTDDLAEGPTNLYYTTTRARTDVVDDAISDGIVSKAPSQNAVFDALTGKQEVLSSGSNIKTINGNSVLGSGDLVISGGGGGHADTDALPEGTTNLYLTAPRVRSTLLSGLDLLLTGAISASDTILQAFGRLQNQISAIIPVTSAEKTLWNNTIFSAGNITGSVSFAGFNLNRVYKATLTGNTTFTAISGGVEGNVYLMIFTQDATGNRTLTLPANVTIPSGESIDLGANKETVLSMYFNGTNYRGSFKKGW